MRFPQVFVRGKAVTGLATVGSDPDPNSGAGVTPKQTLDNMLGAKFYNSAGWPAHRIAVSYKYEGAGPAVTLPATIYLYDFATSRWYSIEAAKTLTVDKIVFFDVVALLDSPQTAPGLGSPTQGSIEAYLKVDDNAGPNGTYTFGIGADLTLI